MHSGPELCRLASLHHLPQPEVPRLRAEPKSTVTKKTLTVDFPQPRASESWDTATEHFVPLNVYSQVIWVGGRFQNVGIW